MKGILHKAEYGWMVRYKKPKSQLQFEIPVHIDSLLRYKLDLEEYQDTQVEFDIVCGPNPFDYGNECEVAKLRSSKFYSESWDDIANSFTDSYSVDLKDSKLSFIPFLNWLKRNYEVPNKKL